MYVVLPVQPSPTMTSLYVGTPEVMSNERGVEIMQHDTLTS